MKIGLLNGDRIDLWHFNAEEIPNLEELPHVTLPDDFVPDPLYDYYFRGELVEAVPRQPMPPIEPTQEERVTVLETENAELKAALDDMILNSPIPVMQAAIDDIILNGGAL